MNTTIYILKDPDTQATRYVGKTCAKLNHRFNRHIHEAKAGSTYHVYNWIRKLLKQGKVPVIEAIETVVGDGASAEIKWIAEYKKRGEKLCNHTDGGEGTAGVIRSAAYLAKHKAVWANPEHKYKVICGRRHIEPTEENVQHFKNIDKENEVRAMLMPILTETIKPYIQEIKERQQREADERERMANALVPLTFNGTLFLPLGDSRYATIDADDWDKVKDHRWFIYPNGKSIRVRTTVMIDGRPTKRNLGTFIVGKRMQRTTGEILDYRKCNYGQV